MARVRLSEDGDLHVPLALREALGLVPGGEVDVSQDGGRMIVASVPLSLPVEKPQRKLTIDELLARRIPYDGPSITDDMIEDAVSKEAGRRWERVQSQSDSGEDEDAVD